VESIDEIIRSRRKTIAIIVQPDGRLVVRAPLRTSQADIRRMVEKHHAWILKKQAQAREMRASRPLRTYEAGDEFWYLGEPRRLDVQEGNREALTLEGATFTLRGSVQEKADDLFRAWYRTQALRLLPDRVTALASRHGFQPRGVRVTSACTRWGSCSPSGMLAFTWRLMIAPWPVIDYVILHELAHLKIRNHSRAFWELVQVLSPDYKMHVRWLKAHAHYGSDL
jgi:hypothetical protein